MQLILDEGLVVPSELSDFNMVSVEAKVRRFTEVLSFHYDKNDSHEFRSWMSQAFACSLPEEGFSQIIRNKHLMHLSKNAFIFISYESYLDATIYSKLPFFCSIENITKGLRGLRVRGQDSYRVLNRLLGITLDKTKKGQIFGVGVASSIFYITKIKKDEFELLIPSSYYAYCHSQIHTIAEHLKNLDRLEIDLGAFFSELRF
jgi:hypothetical protein